MQVFFYINDRKGPMELVFRKESAFVPTVYVLVRDTIDMIVMEPIVNQN